MSAAFLFLAALLPANCDVNRRDSPCGCPISAQTQKTTAVILNEPRLLIFIFAYSVSNLFTPLRLSIAKDIAVIIAITAVAIISANTFGSTCTANR